MYDGLGVSVPLHFNGTAAGQHDDDILVHRRDGLEQGELIFREEHIRPILALGLAGVVQTEIQQRNVGLLRKLHRLRGKLFIRPAVLFKALGKAGDVHAAQRERLHRRVHKRRHDARASRPLIARLRRESADERHAPFAPGYGKYPVLIFQQDGRLLRDALRKQVMLCAVIVRGL